MTANPWLSLPKKPPYVAPGDRAILSDFNQHAPRLSQFDLSLFPEPYLGRPDAPVVLLALDPGMHPLDHALHKTEAFAALARQSLAHTLAPHPFLHLQPGSDTPGAKHWRKLTAKLSEQIGEDKVGQGLLCLHYFPYRAQMFKGGTMSLPSQQYTFDLLRAALQRNAEVAILQAPKLWAEQVPELRDYMRQTQVPNPRNPVLSRAHLGERFEIFCERLSA